MILTCPACATQYRLKDDAIPPEGRTVRCAACKHKWHEGGHGDASETEASSLAERSSGRADAERATGEAGVDAVGIAPPPPEPDAAEAPLAAIPKAAWDEAMIAEEPQPEIPGDSRDQDTASTDYAEAMAPQTPPANPFASVPAFAPSPVDTSWDQPNNVPEPDDQFAAIGAINDEDEAPRRHWIGWLIGLILVVIAAAAAFYFLAPSEMKARVGIAEAGESPLQLMLTTSDRQRLASGNELLAISGRVINATDREQAVPPIHAELRDPTNNRLVYQWTIAPPARSLAPGAAASFNSAEVDVPQGGESLSLRFAS